MTHIEIQPWMVALAVTALGWLPAWWTNRQPSGVGLRPYTWALAWIVLSIAAWVIVLALLAAAS
ncbi:MAG: hypothetical protein AAFU61_08135 [Pseudomonadota bacterium]